MKKRTAFIGAILSLLPFAQSSLIKTGIVLSTSGILIGNVEKVLAKDILFFINRGQERFSKNNFEGCVKDFTKVIKT